MAKTYTICCSVEAMREAFIPVGILGFDPDAEAVMLPAKKVETKAGAYWVLLEFDKAWSLPYEFASIVEEHDE